MKTIIEKEKILGFDVCVSSINEITDAIFTDYNNGEKLFIVNINPEIVTKNYKNKAIIKIFNKQKYQIPDGIGIVYASKIKNGKIKERITGIDLMLNICKYSTKYDAKIYFYGSKPSISEKAKTNLEKKYKRINIVGYSDGYSDENKVINDINNSKANILFVGLGSPKQENFILKNWDRLKNIKVFMPVGGSFDVVSNTLKRAPQKIIDLNLEWLYRLIQEPKRFFRQLNLLKFLFLVIFKKEKKQ